MPDPIPDPAASHVTALRALAEQAVYRPGSLDPAVALPVLGEKFLRALDALDGVLGLAIRWDADAKAAREWAVREGLPPSLAGAHREANLMVQHASDMREAVSGGLLGEGGSDG